MRIGDVNPVPPEPANTGAAKTQAKPAMHESASKGAEPAESAVQEPAREDADATELSRLSHALAKSAASDSRLDQLRLQVQQGTYEVPAEQLSKKIVDFHTE